VGAQLGLDLDIRATSFGKASMNTPTSSKAWDPSGLLLTPQAAPLQPPKD
jgi:hypothetical protein